jgi:hypothetical protein
MPIREKLEKAEAPQEATLRADLKAELESPKESGEPEIIIERPNPFTTHLYVIWSKWQDLEQMVRSRIILDAYTEARGQVESDKVTVAMGVTPDEAARMGIK